MYDPEKQKKKIEKAKKEVREKNPDPIYFLVSSLIYKYHTIYTYKYSICAIVCPVQSMYVLFFLSNRRRICYCSLLTYKTNQSGLSLLLYLGRWYDESDTFLNIYVSVSVRAIFAHVYVAMVQDLKIFLVNDFVCLKTASKETV